MWKVDTADAAGWKVHSSLDTAFSYALCSDSVFLILLQVTLSSELKGHAGPIMALADHPEQNWVSM